MDQALLRDSIQNVNAFKPFSYKFQTIKVALEVLDNVRSFTFYHKVDKKFTFGLYLFWVFPSKIFQSDVFTR